MNQVLKPMHVIGNFNLFTNLVKRMDPSKLPELFTQHFDSGDSSYSLHNGYEWEKSTVYSKLPRCIKYGVSEHGFVSKRFQHIHFYDYNEDMDQIRYDYLLHFAESYPKVKRFRTLLDKFKTKHPELFI